MCKNTIGGLHEKVFLEQGLRESRRSSIRDVGRMRMDDENIVFQPLKSRQTPLLVETDFSATPLLDGFSLLFD